MGEFFQPESCACRPQNSRDGVHQITFIALSRDRRSTRRSAVPYPLAWIVIASPCADPPPRLLGNRCAATINNRCERRQRPMLSSRPRPNRPRLQVRQTPKRTVFSLIPAIPTISHFYLTFSPLCRPNKPPPFGTKGNPPQRRIARRRTPTDATDETHHAANPPLRSDRPTTRRRPPPSMARWRSPSLRLLRCLKPCQYRPCSYPPGPPTSPWPAPTKSPSTNDLAD